MYIIPKIKLSITPLEKRWFKLIVVNREIMRKLTSPQGVSQLIEFDFKYLFLGDHWIQLFLMHNNKIVNPDLNPTTEDLSYLEFLEKSLLKDIGLNSVKIRQLRGSIDAK